MLVQPQSLPSLFPADGLARAAAAERGVDAGAVADFLDAVDRAGLELHGFMLYRAGAVVAEGWRWPYAPSRPRLMHSLTKSVTACAIGMLVDGGRLNLQTPMMDYFPEIPASGHDPQLWRITVEDLLTMRIGHGEEISGALWRGLQSSWIAEFFRIPIVHPPGSEYVYTSAASYMLSAIVSRITGQTLHDYLRPRLFAPLGIEGERWDIGPDGINPGGNGISFTTADALKLGILHAQHGQWNGRQLLSPQWVDAATGDHTGAGYGYHWLVRPGCFYALGVFVQMVMVYPQEGAVLAVNSAIDNSQLLLPVLEKFFPAALHGAAADPSAAAARLRERLRGFARMPAFAGAGGGPEAEIGGRDWQVAPNEYGVTALRFDFEADRCRFILVDGEGRHALVAGRDGWIEATARMPGRDLHHGYALADTPVVAGMRWLDAATLEMQWIFAETAFRDTVRCRFEGECMTLERSVNVNSGARSWAPLQARRAAPDAPFPG